MVILHAKIPDLAHERQHLRAVIQVSPINAGPMVDEEAFGGASGFLEGSFDSWCMSMA